MGNVTEAYAGCANFPLRIHPAISPRTAGRNRTTQQCGNHVLATNSSEETSLFGTAPHATTARAKHGRFGGELRLLGATAQRCWRREQPGLLCGQRRTAPPRRVAPRIARPRRPSRRRRPSPRRTSASPLSQKNFGLGLGSVRSSHKRTAAEFNPRTLAAGPKTERWSDCVPINARSKTNDRFGALAGGCVPLQSRCCATTPARHLHSHRPTLVDSCKSSRSRCLPPLLRQESILLQKQGAVQGALACRQGMSSVSSLPVVSARIWFRPLELCQIENILTNARPDW